MIHTFDLHDRAFDVWREAGVRREVLVHVDAHHDAAHAEDWRAIDIGNFVRAAIRHEMVAAVQWIVPDPMWSDPATRKILFSELGAIAERRPAEEPGGLGARTTVEGVEFRMGPLGRMPALLDPARGRPSGGVLLDIDVDYLLTARYEKRRTAEPLAVPWCWPEDLVARLRASALEPLVTTIATSVTGGFTQLRWAHLARELAARLDGASSSPFLACCASLREAAGLLDGANAPLAVEACRAAVSLCPTEPAAHFHLAEALHASGCLDDARAAYRRAREIDPSYAHAFRTRGPYLYRRNRLREAAVAYREALALDPDDSHAHLGLAMVAIRQGRPEDARRLAEQSLAAHPDEVDAWRTLGEARARLGARRAALQAYERAMALSLRGAAPLGGPWSSNRDRRLIDPRHWGDHAAAGDVHAGLGDLDAAIAHYRIATAGAPTLRQLRRRLAFLKARRRLGRAFGGMLPS